MKATPKITKIVVNMGIGRHKDDKGFIEEATRELAQITGQMPLKRLARKSISNFKLRQGELIGLTVTLRGLRLTSFLNKLIKVVLPRARDFRGVNPKAFDSNGNFTLGIVEHSIFPEIDPNKATKAKSLEVSIVTTCKTDVEARDLLSTLGLPFVKKAN